MIARALARSSATAGRGIATDDAEQPRSASGKCASSTKRAITCQCTCGTTLPRLARFTLSGLYSRRSADFAGEDHLHQARPLLEIGHFLDVAIDDHAQETRIALHGGTHHPAECRRARSPRRRPHRSSQLIRRISFRRSEDVAVARVEAREQRRQAARRGAGKLSHANETPPSSVRSVTTTHEGTTSVISAVAAP